MVEIECVASGIPPPEVSFKHGDTDLEETGDSQVTGNYTVRRVHVSQPGNYTCLAVNVYGNDR